MEHDEQDDAQIAERLVAFLEAGDKTPKARLRQRERDTYFRRVELFLLRQAGMPRVMAYTRNISTGGLGLLTRRGFNVGERFATLLKLGAGAGKYALCRTTFCRYLSDGMCEVGAAFEATAPCLNSNHRIPAEWVARAQANDAPSPKPAARAEAAGKKR